MRVALLEGGYLSSLEQVSAALWPSPQVVYEGYFLPQAADLGDKCSRVSALSLHFGDVSVALVSS